MNMEKLNTMNLKDCNLPDCLDSYDKWRETVKQLDTPKKFSDFIQNVILEKYKEDDDCIKAFTLLKILTRDLIIKHENEKFILCLQLYECILKQFLLIEEIRVEYRNEENKTIPEEEQ